MLTPDYLAHCTDRLLGLYDELDRAIIEDIARRIVKTGGITPTARHQIDKVQQSGMLLSDVTRQVAAASGMAKEETERLFREAGITSMKNDALPLTRAGKTVDFTMSPAMTQALEAAIHKTKGTLYNLTMTTGVTAMGKYMDAVDAAYMKVQSGAFSYDQAIRDAIKASADDGNWVSYASGHRDRLDVAIRRAVLTGLNQTVGTLTELYSEELGAEYYETTAHAGARPSHAAWQGRIFSIKGSSAKYPNFQKATGYGTGDGLCGWNCRHSFFPYFPGLSEPAYTKKQLDWYDAARFVYNGEALTEYEVSQLMRKNEREIRATKRELAGYKAAEDAATDSAVKAQMKDAFETSSVRLKEQEAKYRDLCRQTNHKTDSTRTGVVATKDSSGWIVSWNRSTAQQARWANERKKALEVQRKNHDGESGHKGKDRSAEIASSVIHSPDYSNRLSRVDENRAVSNAIISESRRILDHRNGTLYEDLMFIDTRDGSFITRTDYDHVRGVAPSKRMRKMVEDAPDYTIASVHNHPGSTVPSPEDIMAQRYRKNAYGVVVCHNGDIYKYTVHPEKLNEAEYEFAFARLSRLGYNEKNIKAYIRTAKRAGVDVEVL